MANLRRLSWVDVILIIMLVVGAVITFSASQAKSNSEQEKVGLETRRRATELNLGEAGKEIDLESLRQSVEQARSALAQSSLPTEADAIAVTGQILQYVKQNKIAIIRWDSSYTSTSRQDRTYSAISHSLSVEGKAGDLIDFIGALTHGPIVLVVQGVNITEVEGKKDMLQMELELLVYYR